MVQCASDPSEGSEPGTPRSQQLRLPCVGRPAYTARHSAALSKTLGSTHTLGSPGGAVLAPASLEAVCPLTLFPSPPSPFSPSPPHPLTQSHPSTRTLLCTPSTRTLLCTPRCACCTVRCWAMMPALPPYTRCSLPVTPTCSPRRCGAAVRQLCEQLCSRAAAAAGQRLAMQCSGVSPLSSRAGPLRPSQHEHAHGSNGMHMCMPLAPRPRACQ